MQHDHHTSDRSAWLDLFPESSRVAIPCGTSLFMVGDAVSEVFVIESGAVAELRHEDRHTHVSCLCHAGMLVGVRWVSDAIRVHAVEAIALGETRLRSIPHELFLRVTREDGRYTNAVLSDIAKRVDSARRLTDCLQQVSARDHVLSVLHAIADECGSASQGSSCIAVPTTILQRLTGCPFSSVASAVKELISAGHIKVDGRGVQLSIAEF